MSSIPLTLAEAVPLGTVLLQRLLDDAGIRSLVIKGPAFVELGVRRPRQSNDIDLLVAPGDREAATEALAAAGWSIISHWFPPALDDVIYSTTFRHAQFPSTLDLHHHFSGFFADDAFDALWRSRSCVAVAHHDVVTVGREHALVIEGLNAFKMLEDGSRAEAADRVVGVVADIDVDAVAEAAESVGARHTAAPLITALGGGSPSSSPPPGYEQWVQRGARNSGRDLIIDILSRAPGQAPRVVWEQLTLDPDVARFWAATHGVPYRSPQQILWVRVRRALALRR
ncbi:nucleotidyltransferase family protein [Janibacter sp. RAF20_2_2]|uniref:nucleotidyltransferase family protein n=1 Tax=unclassified Janibacter TaxID=2649294 RepID=UPI003F8F9BC4